MTDRPVHPSGFTSDELSTSCDLRFTRRSGPGGQNRNKVETAVIVTHRPTGIRSEASERRTQGENLKAALFRLRLNLALQVRISADPDAPASDLWQSRCRGGRIAVNPSHDDFPALLAEALDRLDASHWDLRSAAAALGCTPSQLIKLLKDEPRALLLVNDRRKTLGLRALL
jgi:RF-1 domain